MEHHNSISFITNGNKSLGLGHLNRCSVIAILFIKLKYKVTFYVPENCLLEYIPSDIEVVVIDNALWLNPSRNLSYFEELKNSQSTIFLDLLENDFLNFSFLAGRLGTIVSITSFFYNADSRYEDISFFPGGQKCVDFLINKSNKRIPLFSGWEYIVFRDEFFDYYTKSKPKGSQNILVTMGGMDSFEMTPFVIQSLLSLPPNIKVNIVLNPLSSTYKKVTRMIENHLNFEIIDRTENMAELMHNSNFAIINGGLTRYELCITGTPFIALSIHQVQFRITELIAKKLNICNLGVFKDLRVNQLSAAVLIFLQNPLELEKVSTNMKSLIDLKGGERIVELVVNFKK